MSLVFSQRPVNQHRHQQQELLLPPSLLYQQQLPPPPPTSSSSSSSTPRHYNNNNNNDDDWSPPYNTRSNYNNFADSSYTPASHNHNNLRVHVSDLMPLDHAESSMNWNYTHHHQLTPTYNNSNHHQRASSNSSVGSAGPTTPYASHTSPLVSTSDYYDGLPNSDTSYNIYQKALPTPTHTPLREVFSAGGYQSYTTNSDPDLATIMALQQKNYQQQQHQQQQESRNEDIQERPSMPNRDESSEDFGGRRKMDYQQVPKLDRTISDVFADELYSPNFSVTSAPPQPRISTEVTSPSQSQSLIAQRLQAANSQHLSAPQQFPMTSIPRDRSPFRQGSPLDPSPTTYQMSPLSAASKREREKAENDAKVLEEHLRKHSPGRQDTQQTISPKDALLEYHESEEDANMGPLIDSSQESSSYRTPKIEPNQADDTESLQSYDSMATSRRESSSAYSASSQTTAQPSQGFNFAPPSIAGRAQMPQVPQQYPFVANQALQPKSENNPDSSPEFHSTLVSMESSSSEYVPESEHKKPNNVAADGGTYTCTYQGCTLRFDTPAKLQKHKKDGHRQVGTTGIASSTRGSSEGVTARNSQAGPHRCDRVNPSTGKPCNTVFSRPYDLTRHEDTIHNARHQKIRCSLCTEVKTFSRNDALTRHFRVVHPEVELPGKTRRRHVD